jgi:hypothetical protein
MKSALDRAPVHKNIINQSNCQNPYKKGQQMGLEAFSLSAVQTHLRLLLFWGVVNFV